MLFVLGLAACGRVRPDPMQEMRRELITAEEIEASNARDAYDAIKKLRANFLSYRGRTSLNNTSSAEPIVYVDDQLYGPLSSLRTIPAGQIEAIRLYRAWEATSKYGTGLMGGVIAVYTRQ
jgi:outer membrane receptor for ferrienterochelin and colicin